MTAAELRALAKTLRHETPTTPVFTQAAEIIDLLAWAEQNNVEAVRRRNGYSVHVGLVAHNGDTLIDTLRRAREAAR